MNIIYKITFLFACPFAFGSDKALEIHQSTPSQGNHPAQKCHTAGVANIVFKSTDGGQTWKDISEGLPESIQEDGLFRDDAFADGSGLHLRAGNKGIFHSISASAPPFWKKESSLHWQGNIAPGRNGIFAYNYDGQFFQKMPGATVWSPVYANFYEKQVRSIFETAKGTSFISCDYGLYKSTDRGKTWKRVLATGSWAMKLAESDGVLMATSQTGILRSTDDGETWDEVLSEGGVGITVERIKGGFAAITFNGQLNTRKVHTTYDGGISWQPIDAGLPPSLNTASIIQVGENFFCGHPDGIYQSSDRGKTWKLILPSVNNLVFNLFVSGNIIYAIPLSSGC